MDKKVLLLRDKNFSGPDDGIKPTPYFDWDVDYNCCKAGKVTVFTDHCLNTVGSCTSEYKIAWLVEPPAIVGFAYDYVKENYELFDYVITCSKELMKIDDRFVYCPAAGTTIDPSDRKVHIKKKMVSTIASNKLYVPGHAFRHQAIAVVKNFPGFDIMGSGYRRIENKIEGLKDYQYSLSTENCQVDGYFTEKIIDCFITGTVPIYWGCPTINSYFDSRGIICFEELSNLPSIFENLSYRDYQSRLEGIRNNFEIANKVYTSISGIDLLWNCFFKDFLEKI